MAMSFFTMGSLSWIDFPFSSFTTASTFSIRVPLYVSPVFDCVVARFEFGHADVRASDFVLLS